MGRQAPHRTSCYSDIRTLSSVPEVELGEVLVGRAENSAACRLLSRSEVVVEAESELVDVGRPVDVTVDPTAELLDGIADVAHVVEGVVAETSALCVSKEDANGAPP